MERPGSSACSQCQFIRFGTKACNDSDMIYLLAFILSQERKDNT
jgi:hypothetical protein